MECPPENIQNIIPWIDRRTGRSSGFRNSGDTHIDIGDLVPGVVVGDTGFRKAENALKGADGIGRERTVYSVCSDRGNGRVITGDAVQLCLQLPYLVS